MRNRTWTIVWLVIGLILAAQANAQIPCAAEFGQVTQSINQAPINLGDRTKLNAHLKNAWRIWLSENRNRQWTALQQLDVMLRQLSSKATKNIPASVRETLIQQVSSLKNCIANGPTTSLATLTVRTFLPSDVNENGILGPAPGGGVVFIENTEYGVTSEGGTATLQVPSGALDVQILLFPGKAASQTIELLPGESKSVDFVFSEGKKVSDDSEMIVDQLEDGVLDRGFTEFSIHFSKLASPLIPLESISIIQLIDPRGGPPVNVSGLFELLEDGTLRASEVIGLRQLLLQANGRIILNVRGVDVSGRSQDGFAEFFLSAFRISGQINAPPSNPLLNLSGIVITGSILNSDLVVNVTTDSQGKFEFPLLPRGNFEFASETEQGGMFYYGQGILVLNGNKNLSVNMLHTSDLINGVIPFSVTNAPSLAEVDVPGWIDGEMIAERQRADDEADRSRMFIPRSEKEQVDLGNSAVSTVSVSVAAGSQNVPVNQTATLSLPQGTKTVELTYTVQTDEYPTYVLADSIFNDTWSLAVRAGSSGKQAFQIGRQINSQLTAEPVWQSDGTTGQIKQTLDVEALTNSSSTSITLFASAMNVGDSLLPTRVNATLGAGSGVKINSITGDNSVRLNFHSVPRAGTINEFDRFFTVKYSKPNGSTTTRVIVRLLGSGTPVTIIDAAPGSERVQVLDSSTLKLNVAIKPSASTIESIPPPFHVTKFSVKVIVTSNGDEIHDEKETGERRALWRMPDGLERYGSRDIGLDDWVSRGTYNWLVANAGLITRIDDISGEHGRNIGHSSHKHGTDIDMFHFFHFPGAESGGDNYTKLIADVKLALQTSSTNETTRANAIAAKERVAAWVMASRDGLDALAARPEVTQLFYVRGETSDGAGFKFGWASQLLRTGKTNIGTQELDLVLGDWSNSKYIPDRDHYNHVHITLNRVALGEPN